MSVRPIGKVCVTQSDVQPKAATAALTTKITVTAKAKQVSPSSIGPMMLDHIQVHIWVRILDYVLWYHIWV